MRNKQLVTGDKAESLNYGYRLIIFHPKIIFRPKINCIKILKLPNDLFFFAPFFDTINNGTEFSHRRIARQG